MSEGRVVLDASALLCLLFEEPGAGAVEAMLPGARISAVNPGEVIDFDRALARDSGLLRARTRGRGLSFADRSCLALAIRLEAPAVTADPTWADLDVGAAIGLIR